MASTPELRTVRVTKAAPATLQRLPGFALVEAFRMMRHAMDDALREIDLTTPQWGTLACLGESEGLTGAEMARIHHLTPQTMHTILQNLEAAGLVARDRDPEHGTLLRTRLTPAGRERLAEGMSRAEAVQERLVSDLDEREREELVELLRRCTQSIQTDGPPLSDACLD